MSCILQDTEISEQMKSLARSLNKQDRARLRAMGRKWLWDQICTRNGMAKRDIPPSSQLAQWVRGHPDILPEEHRQRLLTCSRRNLPIEMGLILVGDGHKLHSFKHLPVDLEQTTKVALNKSSKTKQAARDFYMSWEWKKARFETLKRYGAVCMLCGSEHRIVVDHIKPRSKFPELALEFDNLQVLCNDCNMGKSNDDYTDFRPRGDEYSISELEELKIVHAAVDKVH